MVLESSEQLNMLLSLKSSYKDGKLTSKAILETLWKTYLRPNWLFCFQEGCIHALKLDQFYNPKLTPILFYIHRFLSSARKQHYMILFALSPLPKGWNISLLRYFDSRNERLVGNWCFISTMKICMSLQTIFVHVSDISGDR